MSAITAKSLGRAAGSRAARNQRATIQPEALTKMCSESLLLGVERAAPTQHINPLGPRKSLSPTLDGNANPDPDKVSWPQVAQSDLDRAIDSASAESLRRCVRLLAAKASIPPDLVILMLEIPEARSSSRTTQSAVQGSVSDKGSNAVEASARSESPAKSNRAALLKRSNSFIARPSMGEQVLVERPTSVIPLPNDRWCAGHVQHKSGGKWKKRYIIADNDSLFVLKREPKSATEEQLELKMSLFCVSVRAGDKKHPDFFTLLSPSQPTHAFRCSTTKEAEEFVRALSAICQNLVHQSIGSKRSDYIGIGRDRVGSVVETAAIRRLREIQEARDGNDECADCSQPHPAWVSINLGIFLCEECSGGHRSLGSHISQVRSAQYDELDESQVAFLREMGNTAANLYFEHSLPIGTIKPCPTTAIELKQAFVRAKYSTRAWIDRSIMSVMNARFGLPLDAAATVSKQIHVKTQSSEQRQSTMKSKSERLTQEKLPGGGHRIKSSHRRSTSEVNSSNVRDVGLL